MGYNGSMRNITFKCLICGKEFTSKKACKTRTPKYCSQKCYGLSLAKLKKCLQCGKEFYNYQNRFFCSMDCNGKYKKGKPLNEIHKDNLSKAKIGKPIKHFIENKELISGKISEALTGKPQPWNRGENHPNWQGGKTESNAKIRNSLEMKNWRREVFERDDYTCKVCGKKGGRIRADHIKPFCLFPELRFVVSNGRTICEKCDLKSDTYGGRALKVDVIRERYEKFIKKTNDVQTRAFQYLQPED